MTKEELRVLLKPHQVHFGLEEAAIIADVSRDTLKYLATSGRIPYWKSGREWKFHIDDLRVFGKRLYGMSVDTLGKEVRSL